MTPLDPPLAVYPGVQLESFPRVVLESFPGVVLVFTPVRVVLEGS